MCSLLVCRLVSSVALCPCKSLRLAQTAWMRTVPDSYVEVQLVGRLQAVGTQPHDFLACLPPAPAVVLGIDQAAPGLPAVGPPVVRHRVFAGQATQRNAKSW